MRQHQKSMVNFNMVNWKEWVNESIPRGFSLKYFLIEALIQMYVLTVHVQLNQNHSESKVLQRQ